MADIIYTAYEDQPEGIIGFEQYSQEDKDLISSFQIKSTFDYNKHRSELHIFSLADDLLESNYLYNSYKLLGNAQSAGQDGASVLTIDPIADSKAYGYSNGGVKLLYHFLDDLYSVDTSTVDFFIQDISLDRTELLLSTLMLTPEVLTTTTAGIKANLESQSYFTGFRLNFKNNDLLIATNIDTLDSPTGKVVVVKLYEPLPNNYTLKSPLSIVDIVSDSIAYEVDAEFITPPVVPPTLRSPNFNIDVTDDSVIPTGYSSYDELFSYPVNNSNSEIFSLVNEKGIEISVDYTDFNNFIHFSSAQERLLNFKYKLDLINTYSASLSSISTATTGLQGISGSRDYYQNLMTGVLNNFDHYERFLYYESGSNSWPKSNTTKPYTNKVSTTSEATTWYSAQIATAVQYDLVNYNSLIYSIPTFLRDDPNNENYLTFVYMVGQHFDNLWLYSKAVTDKYDADNRIDHGISKDLVGEALKNFGVKLYTSNKSIEDLFTTFIGQSYQSGSEQINHYITGSLTGSNKPIQPISYDNYQKEVQKRIYHNLPLLLKSKGTERGLRALINCLGISGDILDIKLYGGRNVNEKPFFGDSQYYTSSLDKIRLDNTGSIISGSTLSNYVSITKRDNKYTDDIHIVEVGFAPVDNVDSYIRANITGSFNIDEYIGDPSNLTSNTYSGLYAVANTLLSGSLGTATHYDLQDYVKLIKFYDNTVFKMVKDFIPARAVADTGIIIKPNLLNRSKAKSVVVTGSRPEMSASIDTAFIAGGNAGIFDTGNYMWKTGYEEDIQTPTGLVHNILLHNLEQASYNGELSGSNIVATNGNLTANNPYLVNTSGAHTYDVHFISSSTEVCLLKAVTPSIQYITSSTDMFNLPDFFNFATDCPVSRSLTAFTPPYTQITFPYSFGTANYGQYTHFSLSATDPSKTVTCQDHVELVYGVCNITQNAYPPVVLQAGNGVDTVNLTDWFNTGPAGANYLQYTASWGTTVQGIPNPTQYNFTQPLGTEVVITVRDTALGNLCNSQITVQVSNINLATIPTGSNFGLEFKFGRTTYGSSGQVDNGPTTNTTTNTILPKTGNINTIGNIGAGEYIVDKRIYEYLGTTSAALAAMNRGIPGYFLPYNSPIHTVGIGTLMRFSILEVTCDNADTRSYNTQWKGNWHIKYYSLYDNDYNKTPYFDKSPMNYEHAMAPGILLNEDFVDIADYYRNAEKSYNSQSGPYRYFFTGSIAPPAAPNHIPPFALTIPTPIRDEFIADSWIDIITPTGNPIPQVTSGHISPLAKHTLTRAYVVQGYKADAPNISKQVTVYGSALTLNSLNDNTGNTVALEGIPTAGDTTLGSVLSTTSAKFIDIWLLTNWDYSTGTPQTITPNSYNQSSIYKSPDNPSIYPPTVTIDGVDTVYGPWVKVPVRYFWREGLPKPGGGFITQKEQIMYVIGQQWGDDGLTF